MNLSNKTWRCIILSIFADAAFTESDLHTNWEQEANRVYLLWCTRSFMCFYSRWNHCRAVAMAGETSDFLKMKTSKFMLLYLFIPTSDRCLLEECWCYSWGVPMWMTRCAYVVIVEMACRQEASVSITCVYMMCDLQIWQSLLSWWFFKNVVACIC